MEMRCVFLCVLVIATVTPAYGAAQCSSFVFQPGVLHSLLLAAHQRPWLWGVYVFTVGLPLILFISFMWPDMRFGPPDQAYYYKKSDDVQTDDAELSLREPSLDIYRKDDRAGTRKRDILNNKRKSDLDLKVH